MPIRNRAAAEIAGLAELAAPALKQALGQARSFESKRRIEELLDKSAATPPNAGWLRMLRALDALERIGTPEAGRVLEELEKNLPASRLKEETRRSLKRLKTRPA